MPCCHYLIVMKLDAPIGTHENLVVKVVSLQAENASLKTEILQLKDELAEIRRLIFGQKRERFIPVFDDNQLNLEVDVETVGEAETKTERVEYNRRKTKRKVTPHGRNPIPSHIPRKDIIIEPEEDISGLKKIGEEVTEELEYEPGKLHVNRYIRPKYARPRDKGIAVGSLPSRPIEKGIPGPGLLSHILISKYIDHLPLYRQRKQFLRKGIELPLSTLCDWVKGSYNLLHPLYQVQRELVVSTNYLMVDETPIRVLERLKQGSCHRGFYWVYYAPLLRQIFFDYQPGRSRAGPNLRLKSFTGFMQTDGYTGYDEVEHKPDVIRLGCMAHARRYFDQAKKNAPNLAQWMLVHIGKLYQIEKQARENNLSYQERYELRQLQAVPVLAKIKARLNTEVCQVLPKSKTAKAVGYMLNQWTRLHRYTTDGRLEIDNNLVENAIRPVALGRKNYLFAGSHEGAKRAALVYTMVANTRLHSVEPFVYLKDIMSRIPDHPVNKLSELLACNYKNNPHD